MTLEIGTRLGHYRIVALLGQGGMSDVYRAEDEHLGREVALKAVPPEFARYPERVKRFEREVRAAARLTHANIVTVHEFGQSEGQLFYTMALMTGGDLKARIRAHPDGMPVKEARAVAATMARALDYAHQRGFVHRDVKPENILFGEDGEPRLTDFGIARVMAEETRMTATGTGIGSPRYMSPEQARGQAVDGRSDLYSLGVVFYEMLTGEVPFDAADTFAVGLKHINDPIPELPKELAAWQPLVNRAMAKSPDDRYASAGELAELLASDSPPQVVNVPPKASDAPPQAADVPPKVSDAPPQASPTGAMPALPDSAPATEPEKSAEPLPAAAKPPRGNLIGVAAGLLVVALAGIGYVSLRDGGSTESPPSNGSAGEETVQGEAETPDVSASPEQPADPESQKAEAQEPARQTPDLSETTRVKPRQPAPSRPKPVQPKAAPPAPEPAAVLGGGALLVVETTPAGTEVLVDGQSVGKTPLERTDIRAGTWEVTLRHPHYEPLRIANRKFEDGVVTRLERSLKRGVGRLTVTATPRRAWVEVEGKRLAERTPVTLDKLPAGQVAVRLGAPGHRPLAVEVVIPKDGLARLQRKLERIVYGSLTLELEPSDATVTLPDLGLGYRPGVRLPQGAHRVIVRKKGYKDSEQTVQVSGTKRVRVALEKVPEKAPTKRIRVGGRVQSANLIRRVRPTYPPLARQSRIQGTVVLEAIISKQGYVDNLRVIKGHTMLTEAAMDAVKQWYYKPTVLNGAPVEVITRVTVNFSLTN